jgi:transposase InsO family protein
MAPASERRLKGQLAAHTSWAKTEDRAARTAPARAALDKRFLDEAGGDPVCAEHLWQAYYKRLALKSAISRRKARELTAEPKPLMLR